MRQRTWQLVDDFDQTTPAVETVTFTTDGKTYEIDLSEESLAAWREWIAAARPKRKPRRTTRRSGPSETEIRAWARDIGLVVPQKGRVPATVREAFAKRDASN